MTENDFKNATKIDNVNLVKNTIKADPSQYGSPIPFQRGYSEYEAKKETHSIIEILSFYFLGIAFSVLTYYSFLHYPILNEEWQNEGVKVAIVVFSTVAISFILSKVIILLVKKGKRKLFS